MNWNVPAGFVRLPLGSGFAIVRVDMAAWVHVRLERFGTLEAFASREESRPVEGRGPAHRIDLEGGRFGLIRRLRHGGILAPLSGDRFLNLGLPRPVNELLTSVRLKAHGIPTPDVLAACVYPQGLYYRGEVLRTFDTEVTDLASYYFAHDTDPVQKQKAVEAAMLLAASLSAAGVQHTDYHARNLLTGRTPQATVLQVIDLEKSRSCEAGSGRATRIMQGRLLHSLRKLARAQAVDGPNVEALLQGIQRD